MDAVARLDMCRSVFVCILFVISWSRCSMHVLSYGSADGCDVFGIRLAS